MEIEIISNIIKMIGDNGISLVASAILLYFTIKNFKENSENQKEIIQAIILVKQRLVNGHLGSDDLKIQANLHWLKMINIYKSNIFKYIIQNNIRRNINQIEIELDKIIIDMLNRSLELLKNQTIYYKYMSIMNLLRFEINKMHETSISILKSNIECNKNECLDYKELARIIENHINHFESEVIIKINELKL
ncbi:hypothetical protein KX935_07970 [Streptobacillus moniliformis]|uniref:hypothetical protein n=1 Tax=Streptobacillus moniliformis TaxID=34105 RepID=UPI0007E39BCC|nr:hypothetical protein [Streptobacillus moniliformis]QXW65679.1 hypothetical protein KX935_07970 [Streptobacillus moniliformis]